MRILGIDPGLNHTGWGVIESNNNVLRHVANGTINPPSKGTTAERLTALDIELCNVINLYEPDHCAVEEIFVNVNPASTLKLGMARGVTILVPARHGLSVGEYGANLVKKSIVGSGHASKDQMGMMIKTLLPGSNPDSADAADALAVAICHAHHMTTELIRSKSEAV